jgi:excinuclease UvrABC nuclease subunit
VEWSNSQRFTLTRTSVLRNAPEESGVYGLCIADQWVYIGHTSSVRKALLEYLRGQMPYVLQWQPRHFMFEVLSYKERISRQKELVAHYQPACNRKLHSLARSS